MGCNVSISPEQNSASDQRSRSISRMVQALSNQRWKFKLTKNEAKLKYVKEGSIGMKCSTELLEFRVFLDDPVFLSNFTKFCKLNNFMNMILLWADLLEYTYINVNALEMKYSKCHDIYCKYISIPKNIDIPQITIPPSLAKELDTLFFDKGNSIPELKTPSSNSGKSNVSTIQILLSNSVSKFSYLPNYTHNEGTNSYLPQPDAINDDKLIIRPDIYDCLLQNCLLALYEHVYNPFKKDKAFRASAQWACTHYNKIYEHDFTYVEALGEGTFGFVVHCQKLSTGKHYAMKVQSKLGILDTFYDCPERCTQEREALSSINHPFIVSLDYAFQTTTLVMMVMELGTCGTLSNYLAVCPNTHMPEDHVRFYAAEMYLALNHMHNMGILYRDLKPSNVLLNHDGHIKLVDLGGVIDVGGNVLGQKKDPRGIFADQSFLEHNKMAVSPTSDQADSIPSHINSKYRKSKLPWEASGRSALTSKKNSVETIAKRRSDISRDPSMSVSSMNKIRGRPLLKRAVSIMGTVGYMAPEILIQMSKQSSLRKGYSNAVDFWSLGVTIFVLLNGALPFNRDRVAELYLQNQSIEVLTEEEENNARNVFAQKFVDELKNNYNNDGGNNNISGKSNIESDHSHCVQKGFERLFNLSSQTGISREALSIVTKFLTVDEKNRLGCGVNGSSNVKKHAFFEGINWHKLVQKKVPPPYIPPKLIEEDSSDPEFESFDDLMTCLDKDCWNYDIPTSNAQKYFANWDFASQNAIQEELKAVGAKEYPAKYIVEKLSE